MMQGDGQIWALLGVLIFLLIAMALFGGWLSKRRRKRLMAQRDRTPQSRGF